MREIATYACYTSRQIPQVSAYSFLSPCLMTSLNTECSHTPCFSYKLGSWSAWRPTIKHLAFRVWLLAAITSALFEAIVSSFLRIATCSSLIFPHISPSFTYSLVHSTFLPSTPPQSLLSGWWARTLWSVRCSHWQAAAARCYLSAAPWQLCWSSVSESGRNL